MNRRRFSALLAALPLGAAARSALAQDAKSKDKAQPPANSNEKAKPDRAALEAEFAKTLSGASLVGYFTDNDLGEGGKLAKETYQLGEVSKLPGDHRWRIEYQYGDSGLKIPLAPIDIEWAGDTPVIVMTDFKIPLVGTFTARVLFYRGEYCGTWNGGPNHGGKLFGVIKSAGADDKKPASNEGK